MKQVSALVVAATTMLASTFPQAALADAVGKRVAYVTTSTRQPFISATASTIEREGTARGMKITVLTAGYDSAVQDQLVNDVIAQKYDFLALLTVDGQTIIPALTRAKAAGIPVVLVNNPVPDGNEALYVSYVGEDRVELGRVIARSLIDALKDRPRGRTAILSGTMTDLTPARIIQGFKEAVATVPKVQLVAIEDARWDMAMSERAAGQLFARNTAQGGLDAIVGMADNMTHGAIQAAKAADIVVGTAPGKLINIGGSCMKFGMDHLRTGAQYSTMTVIPTRTGKAVVDVIEAHFNGKSVPKFTLLPIEEITSANMEKYTQACTF
ncbi:MAG: ribose transport system substrate-binding protein [Alphaproteobacteria bacterium]|jgi:ABC-type sugar transport system substrate-binding protein|nr:ribose transport system substrate-binding protein [Alphaproteobacteria bacterium]MEA3026756.1 ribose transport system substrate-binding protein [Alphaproteobacteria bacterium]